MHHDNCFSTWLFYILVCLFLFVFFSRYCSCCDGALKNRSDVKWVPFFNILENFPRIPEKWPWDTLDQFCTGTWPGQENTSNIETKNNDNRKATKQSSLWGDKKNKSDRIFFPQERYLFWYGRRAVGLQKGGSRRVKPNLFIARGESPF